MTRAKCDVVSCANEVLPGFMECRPCINLYAEELYQQDKAQREAQIALLEHGAPQKAHEEVGDAEGNTSVSNGALRGASGAGDHNG